jgi:molybdate/tungstate transport system substrate-binding protein
MKRILILAMPLILVACVHNNPSVMTSPGDIKGNLIVFHAGSLSVPFKQIAADFEKVNPNVKILLESAGSVECARKITDLKRPCDIMASSDYKVIRDMLIPGYTDWLIPFASNELVIAYSDQSRLAESIDSSNWTDVLMQQDIAFARPDPNSDPCGYRTVLMLQLAEKYYKLPGFAGKILQKDVKYIRPKEVDLLALLEVGQVDYVFNYRSVALQHHLKYIELPSSINLKDPALAGYYAQVSTEITGKKPGEKVTVTGEPVVYGVTQLRDAPNPAAAGAFLQFLLDADKGMKTMIESGQNSLVPGPNPYFDNLPVSLQKFASRQITN